MERSLSFGTLAKNSNPDVRYFQFIDLLKSSGLGILYFNSDFRCFKTLITAF